MSADFDIAVIGSGFGGSIAAMIARRLGRSVVLLERGKHPRFAIGESSTPLANLLLEELARRYELPRLLPLVKWGSWQREHPEIACGLKRGFTFYHHRFDEAWEPRPDRGNELLVGASPHDAIADTHWYRADFDHFLLREAQALGVEYVDQLKLEKIMFAGDTVALEGDRLGARAAFSARFVLDATGPRGFLHRALELPEAPFEDYPPTQALYSHFSPVRRWEHVHPGAGGAPYPPDDAAMHHVFRGGWIWVLRFNNGLTSAGVAATDDLAAHLRLSEGAPAWERLLARLPSVREPLAGAFPALPFTFVPRLSFLSGCVAGERWALLPSAAGFVDPLLSTGFPLTLLGIERLARALETAWGTAEFRGLLAAYARRTEAELLATARLIAALYSAMDDFELFASLSRLYFAAASFTETARRLGRPELAGGSFLLADHASFGNQLRACVDLALRGPGGARRSTWQRGLLDRLRNAIGPVDVGGLGDVSRRNWHPARAEDLMASAGKLGVGAGEIEQLLERCGFLQKGLMQPGSPRAHLLPLECDRQGA
jgi:FADH2 O2-dependent halogenase